MNMAEGETPVILLILLRVRGTVYTNSPQNCVAAVKHPKTPVANFASLLSNQKILMINQTRTLELLKKLESILEFLLGSQKYPLCSESPPIEKSSKERAAQVNYDDNTPFPIDSVEKLSKLESDLSSVEYLNYLVDKMAPVCGQTGKMNGINCCYTLVDRIFNRMFLTKFSWSGGSRHNELKLCFKTFKNVMHMFYTIVSKADKDFSEMLCHNFFKSIIKHSNRRAMLLANRNTNVQTRASRGKNRPKNLSYKKKNNTEGANDGNELRIKIEPNIEELIDQNF